MRERQSFTFLEFRKMLKQIRRLGSLELLQGMRGMGEMLDQAEVEGDLKRLEGIVDSMTPSERRNSPNLIDRERRLRIAAGAGVELDEVNEFVEQVNCMAQAMRRMPP